MSVRWCIHEERTFARMSELTKHTKRKHQDLVLYLLEGEFVTEPYVKIIKPTDWTRTIAIRTRAALLGWVERTKKEGTDYEKYQKELEDGWKQALGHSVINHQARGKENIVHPGSSKGKLVYLRMEESATEVWFKVELVHWVMNDTKAKENLL